MHYWKNRTSFHAIDADQKHSVCTICSEVSSSGMLTTGKTYNTRTHVCLDFLQRPEYIMCSKSMAKQVKFRWKVFFNLLLWMNITTVVMLCTTDPKKMTQFHFLKIDFIARKIVFDEHRDKGMFLENLPTSPIVQK